MTRDSDLLDSARAMVESTPGILGGTPVVRGTRIPVHDVGAWAKAGTPVREILRHYPSLTDEQIRLSCVYTEAYPALARPPLDLAPDTDVIVERTLPFAR